MGLKGKKKRSALRNGFQGHRKVEKRGKKVVKGYNQPMPSRVGSLAPHKTQEDDDGLKKKNHRFPPPLTAGF